MAILETDATQPVTTLLQRCHEHLRATRGAAMSLASFNAQDGTLTWLGVGNVDGVVLRAPPTAGSLRLVLLAGVVGHQLPALRESVVRVEPGDTLVLVTDGIRDDFEETLKVGRRGLTGGRSNPRRSRQGHGRRPGAGRSLKGGDRNSRIRPHGGMNSRARSRSI
jgi:hypothetical protein